MRQLFSNDSGRTGWFDHLLSLVAGCLVLYAAGQGISRSDVGTLLLQIYVTGTVFSWLWGSLVAHTKIAKWDGVLYLVVAIGVIFSLGKLNGMLSDNPFEGIFGSLGLMSWLLALGSFATWRDGTMLFQAVPSIAMFGLIGCYDTFRSVTYFFFGFLLCIATLFARINARAMLDSAIRSGSPIARPQGDESPMAALRRGPWKAVAGPTWALLSAGLIVVMSFLSAPIVQGSVESVVGHIRLPLPRNYRAAANEGFFKNNPLGGVQIGNGPVALGPEPVFRIRIDHPRYLRTATFVSYTGRGWLPFLPDQGADESPDVTIDAMVEEARQEIRNPMILNFSIEMLTARGGSLPLPGELLTLKASRDIGRNNDGTYSLRAGASLSTPYEGTSAAPPDELQPTSARKDLTPAAMRLYTATARVPQRVRDLARSATQNLRTDYDKAIAIREEIAGRIEYDQQAPAVPEGRDPVEYTLFEGKRAYCDVFASSMVLMARSIGIPARYVTGFYPFEAEHDDAGRFTVRERDAHAWAELYFKGYGWVPFDATEGAAEADGAGRGASTSGSAWLQSTWFAWVLRGASAAALLGLGYYGLQYARRPRDRKRNRIHRLYRRFSRAMERASGWVRAPYQSPEEYLAAVQPHLDGAYPVAHDLTRGFLAALYGPALPSDPEYADLVIKVRQLERAPRRSR